MDAKSKAIFINSVAGGKKIPCPICNVLNDSDAMFCFSCGNILKAVKEEDTVTNVETIECPICHENNEIGYMFCLSCGAKLSSDNSQTLEQSFKTAEAEKVEEIKSEEKSQTISPVAVQEKRVFKSVAMEVAGQQSEEMSAFAQGLPSWDLVPPQIMVRRKKKK
ncbi:MAG: zinc ribbon domain-containing protein [Lachnospiraceae bacterium]|nr:zinc ribbon domain-containing protein [Lachnospiraceae bacterium]